jgi:hypothetical protein
MIGREWRRVSVSLAYVGSKGVGVKGKGVMNGNQRMVEGVDT